MVDALAVVGEGGLSAARASLLQAQGQVVRRRDACRYWDRNAPLPEHDDRTIPWNEAEKIVLDAYGAFSPELADVGKKFFGTGWIDAPARPGKSPGAFAHPTVPSAHPYLLLNYQGKVRDVMTLAHELGHGVHQVLAARQGALMADTPLTLAETASVFGEMLTFQSLLKSAPDKATRKAMLAGKVEDMLNTVVRQIAFYDFESRLHDGAPPGRADARRDRRDLDGGADGEPGPGLHLRRRVQASTGPISATSSIRRSTSTPMPSATAW